MTLLELVEKAKAESPDFKQRIEYWTHVRRKQPELPWIMAHLEAILGRGFVMRAAQEQIKEMKWTSKIKWFVFSERLASKIVRAVSALRASRSSRSSLPPS